MLSRHGVRPVFFAGIFAFVFAGCSTIIGQAIDSAARGTGAGIGDAIGQRIGDAAGASLAARLPQTWTPDLTMVYVSWVFGVAFHSGSYAVEPKPYEPGEWTRWRLSEDEGEEGEGTMERAFLGRVDDDAEWWRVRLVNQEEVDGREVLDTLLLEGLFSSDASRLIRLRGKFPGEDEPKELPVQEGTFGYVKPVELAPESIEGATVGTVRLQVPAGTFQARHVRYGGPGGGTLEWWLADEVPGGVVKYRTTVAGPDPQAEQDADSWTARLDGHGTGAQSELGVM